MLNWLRRRLSDRQRQIFRYWDGQRLRSIDPVVATRALLGSADFDWSQDPLTIETGVTRDLRDQAIARTVSAVRQAFALPVPVDGARGLVETEVIGLLVLFADYIRQQKKNGNCLLISLLSTGSASSAGSTTPPGSDCGSTATGSGTGPPEP